MVLIKNRIVAPAIDCFRKILYQIQITALICAAFCIAENCFTKEVRGKTNTFFMQCFQNIQSPFRILPDIPALLDDFARSIADEIVAANQRGEPARLILPVGPVAARATGWRSRCSVHSRCSCSAPSSGR